MFMVFFNRYKTVFGSKLEQQSSGLGDQNGVLRITAGEEIDEKLYEDEFKSSSIQVVFQFIDENRLIQIIEFHF